MTTTRPGFATRQIHHGGHQGTRGWPAVDTNLPDLDLRHGERQSMAPNSSTDQPRATSTPVLETQTMPFSNSASRTWRTVKRRWRRHPEWPRSPRSS